jgi:hypothetical protein
MKKENKDIIVDLNFLNDLELVEGVEDPFYSKVDFIQTELKDVFIPNWDNKPPSTPPVLMLNDVPILTYQNTTAIIAHPGFGKSSICESILASIINPDCDSLGFEVSADVVKKAIFIDFERRNEDVWNSWERMIKRAEVKGKKQIDNIYIFGFHTIANFEDRERKK